MVGIATICDQCGQEFYSGNLEDQGGYRCDRCVENAIPVKHRLLGRVKDIKELLKRGLIITAYDHAMDLEKFIKNRVNDE
jgi:DNA-directed RNA polymerase subunit RPC12/RpoP